jgi:hypothetical protein
MIDKCGGLRVTLGHSVKYANDDGEQCFNPKSRRREVSIAIAIAIARVCIMYVLRSQVPMCVLCSCASLRVCVPGMGSYETSRMLSLNNHSTP